MMTIFEQKQTRREMLCALAGGVSMSCLAASTLFGNENTADWKLRYALASCLFGVEPLEEILAVAKSTGAEWIDLWPLKHGNQREQVDEMGKAKFVSLLQKYELKLGLTTRFDLGPFALKEEMKFVSELGGKIIVTGDVGPKGQKGDALKKHIDLFHEQLKPHVEEAEKQEIVLTIENHSMKLLDSPDAVKYFCDKIDSKYLRLALTPYHLPQDEKMLSDLIRHCNSKIAVFYAWQYGEGCMEKLPKEQELKQLPGRGQLDFRPLLSALREINFQGFTEIFMHPVPRGIPILNTVQESADTIITAKNYLDKASHK